MMVTVDTIGRNLNIKTTPQRIVSLAPTITELLSELSLEHKLVGISNQCKKPYYLQSTRVVVGDAISPICEKIEALQPDIIFCEETHSKEIINQLQTIAPVFVCYISSLQMAKDVVLKLGTILKCRTESQRFIQKLDFRLNDFKKFTEKLTPKNIAFFVKANPWISIKQTPYLDEILALNKFENSYKGTNEHAVYIDKIRFQGDPSVILLATDCFDFTDEHAFEIGEYANRSATVYVKSDLFSKFGVHILQAFDYFKELHQRLESHF